MDEYCSDILVVGGGIAGLFTAARLRRVGYSVRVLAGNGGVSQTLACQGMIHGGQKYALTPGLRRQRRDLRDLPMRWDACLEGHGEIDLAGAAVLSPQQMLFSAGRGWRARWAPRLAAGVVRGGTQRLKVEERPTFLPEGAVYALNEKVLDPAALLGALHQRLEACVFRAAADDLLPDGQVAAGGCVFRAEAIVVAAGTGNESLLRRLHIDPAGLTQRRPLRQIAVRRMEQPLYGHGLDGRARPRITVTSHPLPGGGYVWYLGGALAERAAALSDNDARQLARREMEEMFPALPWTEKDWAVLPVDRAEPRTTGGGLPTGPTVHRRGKILFAWPVKLTFAPQLADHIFDRLQDLGVAPGGVDGAACPPLPAPAPETPLWETVAWHTT